MILLTDLIKEAFWSKKPKIGYSEKHKLKSGETITIKIIKYEQEFKDYTVLGVGAYYNNDEIGAAYFTSDETNNANKLASTETVVNKDWQRKGVASKIYDFTQSLGYQILPSSSQSPEGKEFFKGWKSGN